MWLQADFPSAICNIRWQLTASLGVFNKKSGHHRNPDAPPPLAYKTYKSPAAGLDMQQHRKTTCRSAQGYPWHYNGPWSPMALQWPKVTHGTTMACVASTPHKLSRGWAYLRRINDLHG